MNSTRASSLHSHMVDLEKLDEHDHDHDHEQTEEDKGQEKDEPLSAGDEPTNDELPKDLRKEPSKKDEAFLVKFDENDPINPMNFSTVKKSWITLQLGFTALTASLASSIIAPAEGAIASRFHIGSEVTVLVISLYVLGFAVGPLMWAPISEVYGRKWSLIPAMTVLALFSIGTAVSQNPQTVLITRFFAGVFGSAPVSNVSACLGDMYKPSARGIAVTFYAVMVVGGPTLGPVIGSALTNYPPLGWRWTEYIIAIFTGFMIVLIQFAMPELFAPVLLKRKAKKLRKQTGDSRYWHPHEQERMRPSNILTKYFNRPLKMLVTEPMVTCIAIYASFVYGLLYMTLEVFPIVFREQRGYGPVVSTLPFLALFVGVLCAVGVNLANQAYYRKAVAKNNGRAVPEARLPPMVIGGVFFTTGLFWFGWTSPPQYHWALPTVAAGFIGAGFNTIFQQCINYLVDVYAMYAASAVSANTFLRSIFACGLPLAAGPMFRNMGVGPACSVLGAVSCLGLPVPFLFMRYGLHLRKKSQFAPMKE